MSNTELVRGLRESSVLKSKKIEQAILKNPRIDFVTAENVNNAYKDTALSTISGQTMSQPTTVVFMLELLDLLVGQSVLEIGFGSGWVTALIAHIVGKEGNLDAIEVLSEIYKFGTQNLAKYKYQNIHLHNESVFTFLKNKNNKYDRIISGAAFGKNISFLKNALSNDGILVIPQKDYSILKIKKTARGYVEEKFFGFAFVPIIKDY